MKLVKTNYLEPDQIVNLKITNYRPNGQCDLVCAVGADHLAGQGAGVLGRKKGDDVCVLAEKERKGLVFVVLRSASGMNPIRRGVLIIDAILF